MIHIDGYPIDAALSQEPTFDADVTEYPVEKGADVTDHVQARPVILAVEGIVSDTPIGAVADLRPPGSTPSFDTRVRLFEIWNRREPVTVETETATYDNMVMQSFSVPEDGSTGEACRFRATFKQIRLVTNKRTSVPVAVPRAKKKTNRGTVPSPVVKDDGLTAEAVQYGSGNAVPPPAGAIEEASSLQKLTGQTHRIDEAAAAGGGS